jgi:hypothetical protein
MFKVNMSEPDMLKTITPDPNLFSSTTPQFSRFAITCCVLFLLGGALAFSQSPNDEHLPAGPIEQKAEAACLTCHEARIIVQQRLGKAAWTKEVDKMAKWGAEVDPHDRDALIDYLSTNFSDDKPAYDAPHTATKSSPKSSSTAKHATTQHAQESH